MTTAPTRIPPRTGKAVFLKAGQAIKVINTHGQQIVDTWAFNPYDMSEYLSMQHTRAYLNKVIPGVGDALVSNRRRPLLHLEEDTSPGVHDTLIAACDIYRYIGLGVDEYHDNCQDNMYAAMAALGHTPCTCPSPLNLWMNTPAKGNVVEWLPPVSKPGDYVVLRAAIDCIVAMSNCPQDILPINGEACDPTETHFEILEAR
ncbi:urea carboxylase-associated family protein [Pseudodesulfovibrio indicus]|uniref:urea carboxylase-associated family protein n=1 Tax=Pseudodesulfovibrio indicus TaxID=1716143 RepID=UPI002931ABA2|nr:urea carboxylase-associated family protein [Pseudodesulfovibrio indicus]